MRVSAGPGHGAGCWGSPWPPEGEREAGGVAAQMAQWGWLCCTGPLVLRSASAVLCLQVSEHGCWLSLAATARFSQTESKTCVKPH